MNERLHDLDRLVEDIATTAFDSAPQQSLNGFIQGPRRDAFVGYLRDLIRDRAEDLERVLGGGDV